MMVVFCCDTKIGFSFEITKLQKNFFSFKRKKK